MTYQRAAWKALYRLISEHQITESESLAIAKSIFYPSVIEVPAAPENGIPTPKENDRVVVHGFLPEAEMPVLAPRDNAGQANAT